MLGMVGLTVTGYEPVCILQRNFQLFLRESLQVMKLTTYMLEMVGLTITSYEPVCILRRNFPLFIRISQQLLKLTISIVGPVGLAVTVNQFVKQRIFTGDEAHHLHVGNGWTHFNYW